MHRRSIWLDIGDFGSDLKASLADELGDGGHVEPRGVVLHAQCTGGAVETHAADSVYISGIGQRRSN